MTEEQIERMVESATDALDKRFMGGKLPQAEYDAETRRIARWAEDQHRRHVRWSLFGARHVIADPSRDGRPILNMDDLEHPPAERARNARLAVNAPRLLESVEALEEYAQRFADLSEEPGDGDCRKAAADARALLAHIDKGTDL